MVKSRGIFYCASAQDGRLAWHLLSKNRGLADKRCMHAHTSPQKSKQENPLALAARLV